MGRVFVVNQNGNGIKKLPRTFEEFSCPREMKLKAN
jgi:hypothetical protein